MRFFCLFVDCAPVSRRRGMRPADVVRVSVSRMRRFHRMGSGWSIRSRRLMRIRMSARCGSRAWVWIRIRSRPTLHVDPRRMPIGPRFVPVLAPYCHAGWNASTPRWSPDSNSIAFLSTHDEQDGLWVVKLDKPEPRFIAPLLPPTSSSPTPENLSHGPLTRVASLTSPPKPKLPKRRTITPY